MISKEKLIPLLLGIAVCSLATALVLGISTMPNHRPHNPSKSLDIAIEQCNTEAFRKAPGANTWDITECLYHALEKQYPIRSTRAK